jgi:hypothetical protein
VLRPLPSDPPTLFRTNGAGKGLTAADHRADVGCYDVLIYDADDLKTRLEDIREADKENKAHSPLAVHALPETISAWNDKRLLEFRILVRSHLATVDRVQRRFESALTLVGFPSELRSLDVLRSIEEHLQHLRKVRASALDDAWKAARIEIRSFQSPAG